MPGQGIYPGLTNHVEAIEDLWTGEQNTAEDLRRGSQEQGGGDWKVRGTRLGLVGVHEERQGSAAHMDLTLLWTPG